VRPAPRAVTRVAAMVAANRRDLSLARLRAQRVSELIKVQNDAFGDKVIQCSLPMPNDCGRP
jgi:hypothetical protein